MLNPHGTSTPIVHSTSFALINQSLEAAALKPGPRLLLTRIVSWCGKKGRCWYSVETMASRLSVSVRTLQRWKKELIQSGFLAEILSPYRTPYLIPYPDGLSKLAVVIDTPGVTDVSPRIRIEEIIEKRCTVLTGTCTHETPLSPDPEPENVNAVEISPPEESPLQGTLVDEPLDSPLEAVSAPDLLPEPQMVQDESASPSEPAQEKPAPVETLLKPKTQLPLTPDHLALVEEIERATGDTWSRGHFVNLVRQTDEQTVYAALSVTREKMTLESGVNGGAYFTTTLKEMLGLTVRGGKSSCGSITQQSQSPHIPTSPARPTPLLPRLVEPEPEPADPESLKKGWRMSYRSGGVSSLLSWIERCVPESLNVKKLWSDVRVSLPGTKESFAVDRFLDTVVTRMKHAERMTEVRV